MPLTNVALKEFYGKILNLEEFIQVDPARLTAVANTAIWTPGETANDLYLFSFNIVHWEGATNSLATIGVDLGAGGTLSRYFWQRRVVKQATSGWQGPFMVAGNDAVLGWAANANIYDVNMLIRKVSNE